MIRLASAFLCLSTVFASGEDSAYCHHYSDQAMLQLLTSLRTEAVQTYMHDRFLTTCLNSESLPTPPRSILEALDRIRPTPPTEAPPTACPVAAPIIQVKTIVKTPEQALCAKAAMHTVYAGTSWRCVK